MTTQNVLSDFDICLAVAQQAINSQMGYAWKAWKRRQQFDDTIRIFKRQKVKDGPITDSNSGLEATFAPLQVNLAVKDGRLGQVEVTLTMKSGTVTYFDDGDEATYDFRDVATTFLVDLDRSPCDLSILKAIDPEAGKAAQDTISQSKLGDSVFSIEYLFLKFTSIDLEGLPENHFGFVEGAPTEAISVAKRALNLLLWGKLAPGTDQSGGKFILGSVVRRNTTQSVPTFTMTDFIFDVNPNTTAVDASTLNYLGVFDKRELPSDRNAARLKLRQPWLQPSQINGTDGTISGTMGFRRGRFMDEYVIEQFSKALGQKPTQNGLKWTYTPTSSYSERVYKDIIKRMFNQSSSTEVTIEIVPGTNQIKISGKVSSSIHYDGSTWLAESKSDHTEWNYVEGYIPLSGTCTLIGTSIGSDFSLQSDLKYNFGEPKVTKNEIGGFAKLTEVVGDIMKELDIVPGSPQEMLQSGSQKIQNQLKSALDNQLSRLTIDMKEYKFIPPGGGVFTFQNPLFSQAGDLYMDVIYRAP